VLTLVILIFATMAQAQVEETKVEADKAFIEGRYTEAVDLYQDILSKEYVSAELHYNLGNAYFKSNQIAPAILHYERALKLAPNDEDIRFNLKLANLSVKDKVEEIPQLFFINWWNTVIKTFTTDGWAWNAVIAFGIGLLGFLVFRFSSDEGMRRLTFYSAVLAITWGIFSVYSAQKNFVHAVQDNRAVVFATTVTAKSAPDKKGKDLFVIHEGLVVTVSDELNGWVRIKLANGDVGWIQSETVELI
jgi:tetratricopeptide (TPR) repeat protein